ncbi:hypothetical protein CEQ90_04200 [Lewinellaceae bacterium SD302]|nr:hypothetical protein CEQ90_04200 [Lewinellaceae bacterium SD302]
MTSVFKYILFTTCFLTSLQLLAQSGNDLPSDQVDVVRNFEARLAEASRIPVTPVLPPADTSIRRQQYNVMARPLNVDYPAPIIRPKGIARDRAESTQNGLVKLGAGFPGAFYGDLSYHITGLEDFDLGFKAHRHSFNNNSNVENQRSADTKLGAEGTYYSDKGFAINLGADYSGQTRYFYGYNFPLGETDTVPSFDQEDVRQRFNILDFKGKVFNGVRTQADFDYSAEVDFYILDAINATRENSFALTLNATKWINDRDALDIKLVTDFTNFRDTSKQSLNNFSLNPAYTLAVSDELKLRIGANLTSNNDNFNIFPDVEVNTIVVPGVANAFIGAKGGLRKNSYRSLIEFNPFMKDRLRIRNSEVTHLYGGVSGAVFGLPYRAEVGYQNVKRLALFNVDRNLELPRFDVQYDTARIVSLQGTVTVPIIENLDISATATQRFYSLEREDKPWHLPSFSLNTAAIYTLSDQGIQIRADLFVENGVPYRNLDGEAENLNALFDLSLSGEYGVTENIGVWLQLNNLANNKRQRFVQYPTIGINVLGGVSIRF